VRTQCEFYFGDTNLAKDGFLRRKIEESEDGFVQISVLLTFNRLRAITGNATVVAKALRGSDSLEVSADGTAVRRQNATLPNPDDSATENRTVYFEGIPANATHDAMYSVFATCGTVLYISLPRFTESRRPKGYGFVEYGSSDEATYALSHLSSTILPDSQEELRIMSKSMWSRLKKAYKAILYEQHAHTGIQEPPKQSAQPHANGKPNQGPGQFQAYSQNFLAEGFLNTSGETWQGSVVKFESVHEGVSKNMLRKFLSSVGKIAYLDYDVGLGSGYVRYVSSESAQAATKLSLAERQLGAGTILMTVLQGDEEHKYLETSALQRSEHLSQKSSTLEQASNEQAGKTVAKKHKRDANVEKFPTADYTKKIIPTSTSTKPSAGAVEQNASKKHKKDLDSTLIRTALEEILKTAFSAKANIRTKRLRALVQGKLAVDDVSIKPKTYKKLFESAIEDMHHSGTIFIDSDQITKLKE